MSWKMFWQIVLLIIIAAVITTSVKMGMYCAKSKYCHEGKSAKSAVMRPSMRTPTK